MRAQWREERTISSNNDTGAAHEGHTVSERRMEQLESESDETRAKTQGNISL